MCHNMMLSIVGGRMNVLIESVEILVDPPPEVIEQSTVAAGMGILYRYHPDSTQRLAEGFPPFCPDNGWAGGPGPRHEPSDCGLCWRPTWWLAAWSNAI